MKSIAIALTLMCVPQPEQDLRFPLLPIVKERAEPHKLTGDLLYVIEANTAHLVLASPQGLVSISEEVGPLRIRGKFVDGSGKHETRHYKGKQIWVIEASGTGKVELLVIPAGATKAADVVRKTLDVYSEIAPIPPPPKPDPKPDPPKPPDPPTPPAPIPLAGFRVLFIEETAERGKLTTGQFRTLFGKASRDWLDANCVKEDGQPGYRIYDKDALTKGDLKHWQDAMQRRPLGFSVPWVIISNGQSGFEGQLPTTEEGCKTLLEKYLKGVTP